MPIVIRFQLNLASHRPAGPLAGLAIVRTVDPSLQKREFCAGK